MSNTEPTLNSLKNFYQNPDENFGDSNVNDLLIDYLELGIDASLHNDVLTEIPVVKTVVAAVNIGTKIRNRFLARKVFLFWKECQNLDNETKNEFINKLDSDSEYKSTVVEQLMILLDRFEQINKASALAKIWHTYMKDEITKKDFDRYAHALDRINYENIQTLAEYYKLKQLSQEYEKFLDDEDNRDFLISFANVGLLKTGYSTLGNDIFLYNTNSFGKKFLQILGLL